MDTPTNCGYDDTALVMRAIVDLVDANVAPNAETAAWQTEIASLRVESGEEATLDAAFAEVIAISAASA